MRRIIGLIGLVSMLAVSAACSKDNDPGIATATTGAGATSSSPAPSNAAAAFQQFVACMRQHGQNLPEPDAQGNVQLTPPAGGDAAAWNAALQACQHYLPTQSNNGGLRPEDLDGLRAFAACMRAHGVEVSDPDPANGKIQYLGRLAQASKAQIENDPTVKAANDACQDKLDGNGKGK